MLFGLDEVDQAERAGSLAQAVTGARVIVQRARYCMPVCKRREARDGGII